MFCFLLVIASWRSHKLLEKLGRELFQTTCLTCLYHLTVRAPDVCFTSAQFFFSWKGSWKLFKLPFFLSSQQKQIHLFGSFAEFTWQQNCVHVCNKWWVFFFGGQRKKNLCVVWTSCFVCYTFNTFVQSRQPANNDWDKMTGREIRRKCLSETESESLQ